MANEDVLTLDQIAAAGDTEYEVIAVPEWKGSVRLGSLTAEQMLKWQADNEGPLGNVAGLRLLVASLVDADDNRIGDESALDKLKARHPTVVSRLCAAALKLNGMELKQATERKNGSGEASATASPSA